jgi:hypothetical protein
MSGMPLRHQHITVSTPPHNQSPSPRLDSANSQGTHTTILPAYVDVVNAAVSEAAHALLRALRFSKQRCGGI